MAYNQNLGMNPVKSLTDHAYSANFLWFPIASGFPRNIYVGSPVAMDTVGSDAYQGYIVTGLVGDAPNSYTNLSNRVIFGAARAFKDFTTGGTGIVAPSANQGVIPTTIQQYWVGGTVKPSGVQTYVAVQVDPYTLYDMQADSTLSTGFAQTLLVTGFSFSTTTGFTSSSGNTSTGYSTTRLIVGNGTTSNMQLINLSPNIGNTWGTALNNGLFTINNSSVAALKAI